MGLHLHHNQKNRLWGKLWGQLQQGKGQMVKLTIVLRFESIERAFLLSLKVKHFTQRGWLKTGLRNQRSKFKKS